MKLISICCPLLSLLMACGPKTNPVALAEAEEIKSTIAKAESQLNKVDTSLVKNYRDIASGHMQFILKEYKDTMPLDEGIVLSDYKRLHKSLSFIYANTLAQRKEIANSARQMANLLTDLENGLVPEEKQQSYFSDERKAANEISIAVAKIVEMYEPRLKTFSELNPKVEEIVNSVKQKTKTGVTAE